MPSAKPPLSAEDLFRVQFVGSPAISPDGRWIAYTVKQARYEENTYCTHLYVVPSGGGESRQLTFGDHVDGQPRWSPDGKTLAFVSNRKDKRARIYLLPMEGGEARCLTPDLDGGVSGLVWSPDGSKIAFGFRPVSEEQIARRQAKEKGDLEKRHAFKVFKNVHFKEDGVGFLFDMHQHIHVVDVETGAVKQLTDGDTEDLQPAFSPDGKTIAFTSNRLPDPLFEVDNSDVCLVPVGGGGITRLTPQYGPNVAPAFSPDGKQIAFIGRFGKRGEFWRDHQVWTVPVSGGDPLCLTNLATTAGNYTISDTADVGDMVEPPVWSPDGRSLNFIVSEHGSARIARVAASGGEVTMLTPSGCEAKSLSADAKGGRYALLVGHHTLPTEVAVLDRAEGGEPKVLTSHNRALVESRWIGVPEEIRVASEPGVTVHGWILKPPGFEPGKKYPAILEIHGGPHMQYGNAFFHEIQHLAGKGYVLLWTNPRGSQGYGEKHTGAIVKKWGGPDYVDVMAAVDHLVGLGYVDERRLGVTGGSYGGYMTNWIIGHTDRFKAAVTQRSVVNLVSFYGESDFGFDFEYEFFGKPWENDENLLNYLRMSPIYYVNNMKTPLLIVHSEEDHRCPISQAEELFVAMKVLKKDVEMVQFEGESHGLSRGGRPKNRLERLKRIGGWFDSKM